ncbi:oligogalacturonide-binding protein [Natranaerovirga pectinivora]|uniref:Oligogalacturonide-binding protein n=1 Tax=Natranaerovirga pectinivora TaxID=682400 RepID=A0A4R3MMJ8_9FIRM|nr:ABC transporter substrate-binding protein [Natranaerovirga pectinivora]TCT16183.1 oligogalacturonide-binding protein [Natranaerovirga pectinivora]
MKKILIVMIVLALTVSLMGCGNTEQTTPNDNSTPSEDDQITLRMSWWGGDARHNATLEVIDLFEAAYPHITVVPEYTAFDGHFERMAAQLVGRDEPDIMQVNFNWYYGFSPDGEGFYDLSTLENLNLSNWPAENFEVLTINGKIQGIPISIGTRGFVYNEAIYEQAGVPFPETWDDLIQAGITMREVLGPDYYSLGNLRHDFEIPQLIFSYLAQKTGKNIFENNEVAYTEEELTDGFEFLQTLIDSNVIPDFHADSSVKNHENPNWIAGRYAGIFNWNSNNNIYEANLDPSLNTQLVAVPFIKLSDNQLHSGGFDKVLQAWSISANTSHPEEAALFLEFISTDRDAVVAHGLNRGTPLNKVAEAILAEEGLLVGIDYEAYVLASQIEGTYSFHPFFEDNTVRSAYGDVFERFIMGNLSPRNAAEELIRDTNRAVKEAMQG